MKKLILPVIVLQFLVLAFIAGKREAIYLFGDEILLRTAPVDPRDIFRGDYVTLRYDIEPWISKQLSALKQSDQSLNQGDEFFVTLTNDADGFAQPVEFTTSQPDGLFIKGRVTSYGRFSLGIERYYVEQGQGIEIENTQGLRDSWQRQLILTAVLGSDGTAVLKGHRFSDVASELSVVAQGDAQTGENAVLLWRIRNASEQTLTLRDSPNHCAIKLWHNDTQSFLAWHNNPCQTANWQSTTLAPGQTLQITIGFNQARWQLAGGQSLIEQDDNTWAGYRLVWQPATSDDIDRLQSQRFQAMGRVD